MNEKIKQMINSLRSKMEKVLTHMTARNTGRAKISSLIIIGICLTLILTMTVGAAAVMRSTSPTPDTVVDVTEEVTESTMTTEKSEATPAEKEETVPEETEGTEATEATEVTEATEETKPTEESKEKTQRPTDGNSSDSGVYNTWDTCVGTFSVPGVGLSVNCYASASQETVDAKNSAAYFYSQGHSIIGDHVNQGFNKIKSCHEGTTAYLAGVEYECVAVMSGHNDGSRLTTSNGTDIRDMYPGTLVAYTCNGNWQNVTLVFFKVAGTDIEDIDTSMGESSDIYPSEDGRAPCAAGAHKWDLVDSWPYLSYEMEGRARYLHEHFVCSRCNADWVKDTLLEYDPDFSWDDNDEDEDEEDDSQVGEETLPPETEPPIVDEPVIEETEPETEPEESGNGGEEILPPVQNEPTVEPPVDEPPVEPTPEPEPEPEPEEPVVEEPVVEDTPSEIVEYEEPEYSDGSDIDMSNM